MEKDLAHRIRGAKMEKHLDMAKRLVRYIFFQNETNLKKLGKNRDVVMKLTEGMSERETVEIMLDSIRSLYDEGKIMAGFLSFMRKTQEGGVPVS